MMCNSGTACLHCRLGFYDVIFFLFLQSGFKFVEGTYFSFSFPFLIPFHFPSFSLSLYILSSFLSSFIFGGIFFFHLPFFAIFLFRY